MPTTQDHEKPDESPTAPGSGGMTPDEHAAHIHRRKDELLDQGVEETFPASDPVAVKHIT